MSSRKNETHLKNERHVSKNDISIFAEEIVKGIFAKENTKETFLK